MGACCPVSQHERGLWADCLFPEEEELGTQIPEAHGQKGLEAENPGSHGRRGVREEGLTGA